MATIAELTKKLADSEASLAAKETENEALKAENQKLGSEPLELSPLQEENTLLKEENKKQLDLLRIADQEIERLNKNLAEAGELIQEQNAALSDESTLLTESVVVTVDKKKYVVAYPKFNFKGVEYAAADLKENKALAAELVRRRSGILKPLN